MKPPANHLSQNYEKRRNNALSQEQMAQKYRCAALRYAHFQLGFLCLFGGLVIVFAKEILSAIGAV